MPGELVSTKALQLVEEEGLLDRLLKPHNIHILTPNALLQLLFATRGLEPPDVPNE
jgi:hypothetical protein